jgi:hypothetical protein
VAIEHDLMMFLKSALYSPMFMSLQLADSHVAGQLTPAIYGANDSGLSDARRVVFDAANSTGLKSAVAVTVFWFIVAPLATS